MEKIPYIYFILVFLITLSSCKKDVVSPSDGVSSSHVIAFDISGDIYLYNCSDNSLLNITSHVVDTLYYACTSSFSTDGSELLFTLDYAKIGQGDRMSCDRDDVFSYNLITKQVKRLTNTEYRETSPTYSKDGKTIAYVSFENGHSNIFLCDSSGNEKKLLLSTSGYERYPHFVMNDQNILYWSTRGSGTDFYLNDVSGRNESRLTFDAWTKDSPSISSDEKCFVYSGNGIFRYDFAAKNTTQLAPASNAVIMDLGAKISNDSKYVIYLHSDGMWSYVYLMDSDGKNSVNIGKGHVAEFTKDSRYVISISGNGLHMYDIYAKNDSVLLPYTSLGFNLAVTSTK